MKANNIIIVQETHWDREWYLTFQEFRAKLVLLMDKLINILKSDPNYKNFTLDGQTIPLEDYLEVRPEMKQVIKEFVQKRRLSIGPMYLLPDEFLISGESIIRNFIFGFQMAREYGRVMRVAYIPDPFGHIAQLPQIISGFEISSVIFARGFGDEYKNKNLTMEFIWNAPENAASILGIHLIQGYGSVADIDTSKIDGKYKKALAKIKRTVSRIEKHTATPYLLLNSGSDHHNARPEIPAIVKQWNEQYPDILMEQNDFEYYIEKVLKSEKNFNSFQGELRGGKYQNLLSGVFSTRMWIKQRNTAIEFLYEKYVEPLMTMSWTLDKLNLFNYPKNYLSTGLKWLIKNHPHDSICGCSIDQVHNEMKTRFDWSEQIGNEIIKNSIIYLSDLIRFELENENQIILFVFNPLPWKRVDIVNFNALSMAKGSIDKFPDIFKIIDSNGKNIAYQGFHIVEDPKYTRERDISYQFSFLTEMPACGYKIFYILPNKSPSDFPMETKEFKITQNSIENEYYEIVVKKNGLIEVRDKDSGELFENILEFKDVGDWGDEYDFSGPKENQIDFKYTTEDGALLGITPILDGPTHKILQIRMNLKLPLSLSEDRYNRLDFLVENKVHIYISLYKGIKRIDLKIDLENKSKDHRLRVLFPSNIKTDKVYADGHFYIVPRDINLPVVKKWKQDPLPTNHQKDFVALYDESKCFVIFNKDLPEYEAIKNNDGTITIAITLLRCIEWLSRGDLATRKDNAGPDLNAPEAQCLGKHTFEVSLVIDNNNSNLPNSEIHIKGKEFNVPLKPIFPQMIKTMARILDKAVLNLRWLAYNPNPHIKTFEPYLPTELSFLEIDNERILLSALKKSEVGDFLIIRCYNLSSTSQKAILKFYKGISIKTASLVNFLEEEPVNQIKANLELINVNNLELTLEPHVIATIKMEIESK